VPQVGSRPFVDPGREEKAVAQTFPNARTTTEAAHQAIAAAEAKAVEIETPMVIAIVDDGGVLKALSRMDGAALLSVQVAQDKAYTAVGSACRPTAGMTSSRTTRRWPTAPRPASTAS